MPEEGRAVVSLESSHHPLAPAFSDPACTEDDAVHLETMLAELRAALEDGYAPSIGRQFVFHPECLQHRLPLAAVGFRGYRRADVTAELKAAVETADAELVSRMALGQALLSYSCRPLPDGDWINLVILRDVSAVRAWHRDPLHRHASEHLAPQYYLSVRLHGGTLPQGVWGALTFTGTKYYDFSGDQPWYAQRRLGTN